MTTRKEMDEKNGLLPKPSPLIGMLATWLYSWSKQEVIQEHLHRQQQQQRRLSSTQSDFYSDAEPDLVADLRSKGKGKENKEKTKIRVVAISDTHSTESRQLALPEGDILVHAGDLTAHGTLEEVDVALAWLARQPHRYKIWIAGNHDHAMEQKQDGEGKGSVEINGGDNNGTGTGIGIEQDRAKNTENTNIQSNRKMLEEKYPSLTYLQDSSITLNIRGREVKIYGNPSTPRYGSSAFTYTRVAPRLARQTFAHFGPKFGLNRKNEDVATGSDTAKSSDTNLKSNPDSDSGVQDNTTTTNASPSPLSEPNGLSIWSSIPSTTDILITHAPPRHILDDFQGCAALHSHLWRVKPTLHLFGHIHTGHGITYVTWSNEQWAYERIMDDVWTSSDLLVLLNGMLGVWCKKIRRGLGVLGLGRLVEGGGSDVDAGADADAEDEDGDKDGDGDGDEGKVRRRTVLANVASKNRYWDGILRGATVIDI